AAPRSHATAENRPIGQRRVGSSGPQHQIDAPDRSPSRATALDRPTFLHIPCPAEADLDQEGVETRARLDEGYGTTPSVRPVARRVLAGARRARAAARAGEPPHPIRSEASTAIAAPPWIAARSPVRAASIVSPCVARGNPRP